VTASEDGAPVEVAAPERAEPAPQPVDLVAPGEAEATGRAWWTVAGLTVLLWGFQLFGYVDAYPWLSLAVVVLGLWGLGTMVAVWQPRAVPQRVARAAAATTVGLTLMGFFLWSLLQVTATPAYGTDEIAFDQYAAQLLQHGTNPYTHSMAPAFALFHVSPTGYSFLLDGHPVTSLSYPALSFLLYVPFLMAGWSSQLAVAMNVLAWGIGIVVMFVLLPRHLRPLAIVVGSFAVYIGYAVGGVTDALFVPLLIAAVFRWDEFVTRRGPVAWRGPVLLGLAMAVKQTPWLVLPFLLGGVALEARALGGNRAMLRTAGRYGGIALAAFAVPNLPFVVMAPHQWLSGVLTPIASHTVPAGQGLIGLSLFLGVGGGSLTAYTIALVVVFVALLGVYLATYPLLKPWAVIAPAIILFFSARSFGSYLVTLLPAALVAAVSVGPYRVTPAVELRPWRHWRVVAATGLVASLLAVGSIFVSSAPLAIRIISVRTTGQLATVVQLGVQVTNTSGTPQRPAFTVESGGQITTFWLVRGGRSTLRPGQGANYTLLAPNFFSQPPITGGFQVVAFTSSPATVSRSAPYLPTTYHVGIEPAAVNRVIPVGEIMTLRAQILDKFNRPVHLANQPVYLGQVIYGQQGLIFGEAIINDGQIGQTPVIAYTDRSGVAVFDIRGTQATSQPVYFEANLVNPVQFYPYGYSEIVPIRFGSSP
jgi:uncharacterized membrane protein